MKRIALFLLTNILIIATISIVTSLLGLQPYLTANGINYESLAVFCLIWGMGGAFISLAISRKMAKWTMGVRVIDPDRASSSLEQGLVTRVHNLARTAGLSVMPEVGIYDSPELNAFATGPTKSRSLVAVSTGLLQRMDHDEVEGVLAHEVAHIANGDMVTMTLVQGVVNAFVMFFARIAAFAVSRVLAGQSDDGDEASAANPWVHMGLVFLFDILFGILGSIVVLAFSRAREYRADAGAARYAGASKMIKALECLQRSTVFVEDGHKSLATMKIASKPGGVMSLFMTHPSLEDRIARLKGAGFPG